MKNSLSMLALCAAAGLARAQTVTPTVLASAGGDATSAQGSVAWTVGEPVSATWTSASNITTVGFHQPQLDLATLIDQEGGEGTLLVYPNPVRDALRIDFSGLAPGIYELELHDAAGRLIYSGKANVQDRAASHEVTLTGYAAGAYLLSIRHPQLNKVITINKVN